MTTQERILNLQPYPGASYESIDLNRLTVYVIRLLTELSVPTSIENIAVASFRLFPLKFQMFSYAQFPDMSRTNRAILQLRPKYRGWATGSVRRGFSLNSAGEEVARRTTELLHSLQEPTSNESNDHREAGTATLDQKQVLEDLRQSECYQKHRAGTAPSGLDFLDMLSAYSHTPPIELRRSLQKLRVLASDNGDHEVLSFLAWCRDSFSIYLDPKPVSRSTK